MSPVQRGPFFVGLDLGQSHDFTAIAVLERVELVGPWDGTLYTNRKMAGLHIRYLERVALGTSYPAVVDRVRNLTNSPQLKANCYLVVDATGVGRPVVDLLSRADLTCTLLAAQITGGDTETQAGGYYRVPKRDLIVGIQVLLQRGALRIAGGLRYGDTLVEEMMSMQVKQASNGHEQYGAWRSGEHDDLVLAVALACWGARKMYPWPLSGDDGVWRYEGDL